MSTLKVQEVKSGPAATPVNLMSGLIKAAVAFNGIGTVAIITSNNITSITDNGPGNYTLTQTNTFSAIDYPTSTSGTASDTSSVNNGCTTSCYNRGTTSASMNTGNNQTDVLGDLSFTTLCCMGDLA